ncbi:MAG: dockerin type I domain-containing protein [Nanobdellota archaeon]
MGRTDKKEENSGLVKYVSPVIAGVAISAALNAQEPANAIQYLGNLSVKVRPNDSTDNYYGSGNIKDYNKVDEINQEDVSRLDQFINGTYTDPNDRRLKDRADVNGDGSVNSIDKTILQDYVNRTRAYLPSQLNKTNASETLDWIKRMIKIDNPSKTCPDPEPGVCDCTQFSEQMYLNFHGANPTDLQKFLETYSDYETLDNGRFNINITRWDPRFYDSLGKEIGAHNMNGFFVGEDALNFYDWAVAEPQENAILEMGQGYLGWADSSSIDIRGLPIIEGDLNWYTPLGYYIGYSIKNKIPSKGINYHEKYPNNPAVIQVITQVDHNNPNVDIISPSPGLVYASTPRLITNVEDETIFDRYKLAADGVTKMYYNKNIYYLLNSEQAKNEMFKHTDRALDLAEGDHTITVKAKDEFDNETTKAVSFAIDKTNPDLKTTSPKQDSIYNLNNVNLAYNMSDLHLDLAKSYFTLNGAQQFFTTPSGIILLNSRLGENRLEIISKDKAGNETKKTIDYEYTPQTGLEDKIEYSEYGDMPNPTTGVTKSYYPKNKTVVIRYWDMSGKKVKEVKDFDGDGETSVDFSNEPDAMYLRETIDEDGNRNVGKVLKASSGK